MKVCILSTRDLGGAGKAAVRLHLSLLESGVDSKILFLSQSDKTIPNSASIETNKRSFFYKIKVKTLRILEEFKIYKYEYPYNTINNQNVGFDLFSFPFSQTDILFHPFVQQADVINIHWIGSFIDYPSFFSKCYKPIVWTLHDMNPLTGGCHYSFGCEEYKRSCEKCPQLTTDQSMASSNLKAKRKAISGKNISIVALSNWLKECSSNSYLLKEFNHYLIPNGINDKNFRQRDQKSSRDLLGLPLDKKIILFISDSIYLKRKGFNFLKEAINKISKQDVIFLVVGSSGLNESDDRIRNLGQINDEILLSAVYSAADALVVPSLEDNLPNTAVESLMCGTPVIGFAIGGMKDLIEDQKNGLIVKKVDSSQLANAIELILDEKIQFNKDEIESNAKLKYASRVQSENYKALFNGLSV